MRAEIKLIDVCFEKKRATGWQWKLYAVVSIDPDQVNCNSHFEVQTANSNICICDICYIYICTKNNLTPREQIHSAIMYNPSVHFEVWLKWNQDKFICKIHMLM